MRCSKWIGLVLASASTLWGTPVIAQEAATANPALEATPSAEVRDPEPTTPEQDLAKLLADVTASHRGATAGLKIDSFSGKIEITETAKDKDQISVVLDVRFQDRPTYMRYKVDENGKRIERGRDGIGMWTRLSARDRAVSLGLADYEDDRNELKKHMRLARQLLRFLDPVEVIAAFDAAPEVREEELPIGRNKSAKCRTVTGHIKAFPLYAVASDEAPSALVKLWIDRETNRLIAVQSNPLDRKGTPAKFGEILSMPRHSDHGGVLLPEVMVLYALSPTGDRSPMAKVRLIALELGPDLSGKFDRDIRW